MRKVDQRVESCTQQDVELHCQQVNASQSVIVYGGFMILYLIFQDNKNFVKWNYKVRNDLGERVFVSLVIRMRVDFQVWMVSSAEPQLPLLIEDAARPETDTVSLWIKISFSWYIFIVYVLIDACPGTFKLILVL